MRIADFVFDTGFAPTLAELPDLPVTRPSGETFASSVAKWANTYRELRIGSNRITQPEQESAS